jgi:hypothetical protein
MERFKKVAHKITLKGTVAEQDQDCFGIWFSFFVFHFKFQVSHAIILGILGT